MDGIQRASTFECRPGCCAHGLGSLVYGPVDAITKRQYRKIAGMVVYVLQSDLLVQRICAHSDLQQFSGNCVACNRIIFSQPGMLRIVCSFRWPYHQLSHLHFSSLAQTKELLGNQGGISNRIVRACLAFFLGGICCSIRFTCLAAFVPMGILLAFQEEFISIVSILKYLGGVCGVFGLSGIATTLLLDRAMYGFWAVPFLGNIHFNVIQGKFRNDRLLLSRNLLTRCCSATTTQGMEACMGHTHFIGM
jgi:hypothetical protein